MKRKQELNQFAPLVEPAPGMNFTTTVGAPGNASESNGAKKFAHLAEPPVSENGIVHSIVLPDISMCQDKECPKSWITLHTEKN